MTKPPTTDAETIVRRVAVTTERERLLCKPCHREMIYQYGITTLESNSLHRCPKCGAEVWTHHAYPRIVYTEME